MFATDYKETIGKVIDYLYTRISGASAQEIAERFPHKKIGWFLQTSVQSGIVRFESGKFTVR